MSEPHAQPSIESDPATVTYGLPVDWDLAHRTALRLVAPGPPVEPAQAAELVAQLRADAVIAEGHVRDVTGMGAGLPLLPADVVDRRAWAGAAVQGMAALTAGARLPVAPPADWLPLPRTTRDAMSRRTRSVTGATAALQIGGMVAYLGARVLGQYDPFGGTDGQGRLLLVAPNVHSAQLALDVPAADFGLWVCLHEATHRLQFTAVPWLREHFAGEVGRFLSMPGGLAAAGPLDRLPELVDAIRSNGADSFALVELLLGPEHRAALDRLVALSTLLEGHADHVMDAAGPEVVPTVEKIRERFTARRRGGGLIDRLLRAMLGVEAKMRQYAVGAAFTDHVVDAVGMEGFNRVWTSPETLPTRDELANPDAWLDRTA